MLDQANLAPGTAAVQDSSLLRVAICGEFRAGKSAMLNALFRENLLKDNVGNDARPTVFAEWGESPRIDYFDHSGHELAGASGGDDGVRNIQITFGNADLSRFEFVEIPFSNAENLTREQLELVRSSDILIWVTIASQAWRLTEKTIFEALGEARPEHCILAVSRADKLRSKADQDKISGRIGRETGAHFQGTVFMRNARQRIAARGSAADPWSGTGAGLILAELETAARRHDDARLAALAVADDVVEVAAPVEPAEAPEPVASVEPSPAPAAMIPEPDTPPVAAPQPQTAPLSVSSLMGEGVVVGMFANETDAECTPLLGELGECQTLGEACRNLGRTWLSSYTADGGSDDEFGVAMRTDSHSIHVLARPNAPIYFMKADLAKLTYGAAHNRFIRLCRDAAPGMA